MNNEFVIYCRGFYFSVLFPVLLTVVESHATPSGQRRATELLSDASMKHQMIVVLATVTAVLLAGALVCCLAALCLAQQCKRRESANGHQKFLRENRYNGHARKLDESDHVLLYNSDVPSAITMVTNIST